MEELFDLVLFLSPILTILELAGIAFGILYMHFTAKHRNYELTPAWYVCGVFFSFITLMVFLGKKKSFSAPDTKTCVNCNRKFPENYNVCTNCGIELPAVDVQEKEKCRKCSKGFGIAVIIIYSIAVLLGIVIGVYASIAVVDEIEYLLSDDMSYYDEDGRIDIDGVYYDKKGNSYANAADVPLYDEQGRVYTYVTEEKYDEDYGYTYSEEFYVRDDGDKYFAYDCYVTEDGWFYCDKAGLLELYTVDTSTMTEEELDAYYDSLLENPYPEYRYYDYWYTDAEGNIYYDAYEASWNAQGQLITAENDVPVKTL